jgi:hypothetical protein
MTQSLTYINSIVSNNQINQNFDVITNQLIQLSSINNLPNNAEDQINQVVDSMINNINSVINDITKVSNVFEILNNNYGKVSELNNKSSSLNSLKQTDSRANKILSAYYQQIISGQSVEFISNNFQHKVAKVSIANIQGFSVSSSKTTRRTLSTQGVDTQQTSLNTQDCTNEVLCLSGDTFKNITSSNNVTSMGVISSYKSSNLVPIPQKSFSTDSLNLNILNEGGQKLNVGSNPNFQYKVQLNQPSLNQTNSSNINQTTCVQLDDQYNPSATDCETWYDYQLGQILCYCKQQGLSVNVFDKTLSSYARLAQFPGLTSELCKFIY